MSIIPISFRPAMVLPSPHLQVSVGEDVSLLAGRSLPAARFRSHPLFQEVREKWPRGFAVAEAITATVVAGGITACSPEVSVNPFTLSLLSGIILGELTLWGMLKLLSPPKMGAETFIRMKAFSAPEPGIPYEKGTGELVRNFLEPFFDTRPTLQQVLRLGNQSLRFDGDWCELLSLAFKKGIIRKRADFETVRKHLSAPAFQKVLNKVTADFGENFLPPEEFQRVSKIKTEALEWTKIAAGAILRNDLRAPLVDQLRQLKWPLEALLLEAHQLTSEISGKSRLKTSSRRTLLLESLALGDLTGHLPTAWQKHPVAPFPLEVGEWRLRKGAVFRAARVEEIRSAFGNDEPSLKRAVDRFSALGTSEYPEERMGLLSQILLPMAGRDRRVSAALRMLKGDPHQTVKTLWEFLAEGGAVSKIIRELYHAVPPEKWMLKGSWRDGTEPLRYAPQLARRIREVWSSSIPKPRKEAALLRMLQRFGKEDIRTGLLPEFFGEKEIREVIRKAFAGNRVVCVRELERKLLNPLRRELEIERDKFEFQVTGRMMIGVEPVKGITDILYGDSTGVCTAQDVEAWEKPSFMLFRFTAIPEEKKEEEKKIIGYAQIVLAESEAGGLLTIPGINPSHEFMKRVRNPELFFDKLVEAMASLGRMAGFRIMGIPETPWINSNRPAFQRAIDNRVKEGSYQVIPIPEVVWNFGEEKFPFSSLAVPLFTKE